jgi:methylated-DNA-protein-cysteine methyltransferase-like protein
MISPSWLYEGEIREIDLSRRKSHLMSAPTSHGLYGRIYTVVRLIPWGRVATYGQIAAYAGRCTPRQVGYAMAALRDGAVPWQRVINSKGRISFPKNSRGAMEQRRLLETEGIVFDRTGQVDLKKFGWDGP